MRFTIAAATMAQASEAPEDTHRWERAAAVDTPRPTAAVDMPRPADMAADMEEAAAVISDRPRGRYQYGREHRISRTRIVR
ncbi:MAG TPA: hypothetical protein VHX86_16235 [Tepidisphaeraceae bacterium]|jgi:hypothetical protein|nr:hypothetical protein [Tepidisphaeraceae bacterium]